MRIAILTTQGDVLVEFPSETFRELLKTYLARTNDVDQALDQIEAELKQLTLTK